MLLLLIYYYYYAAGLSFWGSIGALCSTANVHGRQDHAARLGVDDTAPIDRICSPGRFSNSLERLAQGRIGADDVRPTLVGTNIRRARNPRRTLAFLNSKRDPVALYMTYFSKGTVGQ